MLFEDRLGVVDFHPSSEMGVVYITEAELVTGNLYKRKVAKLRRVSKLELSQYIKPPSKIDSSKHFQKNIKDAYVCFLTLNKYGF